ncbi:MAG: VapA/VapB family virulence-associated protein [Vicingaceae bacterium]
MSKEKAIKPELLAHDLRNTLGDNVEPKKMEAMMAELESEGMDAYPAKGNIVSLVFYTKIQVYLDQGGPSFEGHAGGVNTPGAGATFGHVYTKDLDRLRRDTGSFTYTSTPVYFAVYFFDRDQNLLGSFQAGAVSIVTGTGGGSGSWK